MSDFLIYMYPFNGHIPLVVARDFSKKNEKRRKETCQSVHVGLVEVAVSCRSPVLRGIDFYDFYSRHSCVKREPRSLFLGELRIKRTHSLMTK